LRQPKPTQLSVSGAMLKGMYRWRHQQNMNAIQGKHLCLK
jgi:hypothetical protein